VADASYAGATLTNPVGVMLEPGEEIDISAIIATTEKGQVSSATVDYEVAAWIHKDGEVVKRADDMAIEIVEGDGWSGRHVIELAPVEIIDDPWLTCPMEELPYFAYTSCRFTKGLRQFKDVVVQMTQLAGQGLLWLSPIPDPRFAAARLELLRLALSALKDEPGARDRLGQEIWIDLQALKSVTGDVLITLPNTIQAVDKALQSMGEVLDRGDLKEISGGISEFLGESPDLLFESLVPARTLGRSMLAAGVDFLKHPKVWRDSFGARAEDIAGLLRVAKEEGVIIAFRSRAPKAAELLDRGLAVFKPHGVGIKTVNDIDRIYLGYLDKWEAIAVLVEPPVPWRPKGAERDAIVEAFLDKNPKLTGTNDFSRNLRAAVRSRLETRLNEWPKQLEKFSKYVDEGIDVNFAAPKQGILPERIFPDDVPNRDARVLLEEIPASAAGPRRQAFRLQMRESATGAFKDITGDIDLLAIFNLDGTVIKNLAKRTRIYKQLQRLIGMQHGESFTFMASERLRQEFLSCCTASGERMLAAMPDLSLRSTFFDDALSVLKSGPNEALATEDAGEFAYLAGLGGEVQSKVRPPGTIDLPDYFDLTSLSGLAVKVFSPARLTQLVDSLSQLSVPTSFERNSGVSARPTADGGLQTYGRSGDQPAAWSPGPDLNGTGKTVAIMMPPALVDDRDPGVVSALEAGLEAVRADGYVASPLPAGAEGGRWVPVEAAELMKPGRPDLVELAPMTYLRDTGTIGSTTVDIYSAGELGMDADSPFFAVGDGVVLDPGGAFEESAVVVGLEPLTFAEPLSTMHTAGTGKRFGLGYLCFRNGRDSSPAPVGGRCRGCLHPMGKIAQKRPPSTMKLWAVHAAPSSAASHSTIWANSSG